ncbi:phosphoserine phosphatase SerB [Schumannella sp. 10F1B-5-1]|uniref:phosphoserine phosphatase SerB n=1 Tax=Schumannella sp. 10F1B-5-1 TaxID=2590780 RepID=UPI0011320ECD|nr:phosphoserine phosphatase SerB [Schumannella sp. 10F1B-5-1]TPW71111.1 phosphoserine phosphatase SerB [Schumannella sp. 10F1B-5-1]
MRVPAPLGSGAVPRFLVVLDVDSTLIENEVIELLADEAGSAEAVRDVTFRAMNGELDFEQSLRERAATLAGLDADVFARVGEKVVVTPGVPELVAGVQAAGGRVAVVSGGFHEVVDPVAERLGLDHWRANRLEVVDGRLTGGLTGPIIDAAAKSTALREWADALGVPLSQTVAIGDGANDLDMMSICGLSIGFDAKAPVRDEAAVLLDRRDLSLVLPLLGLPRG